MCLADMDKYITTSARQLPFASRKARGASRYSKKKPAKGVVWLFALAVGLTTVTIAPIPSLNAVAPHNLAGIAATPPAQIVRVATIDSTFSEIVKAPSPGLLNDAAAADDEVLGDWLPGQTAAPQNWVRTRVRKGDTLLGILHRQGLSGEDVDAILNSNPKPLYRLIPGQTIAMRLSPNGQLRELTYDIGLGETLSLKRQQDRFLISKNTQELDTRLAYITGTISSSLFEDGQKAGLSDAHIIRLAEIFGWDIDFALDVWEGDTFSVIHEEKYWLGEKVADGPIIAAEFVNRGRTYRAIAHRNESGRIKYYTLGGMSMRRTFLRSPVKFSRISSRYTRGRYHPILKRWRAHKGVDYAANTGTRVRATAKGRVLFRGRKGGYGKTIIIKHGGSYSTLYAHLSGYNRVLRVGSYVDQGDIIGYVGKTGLATGPHLHYEFRVHDKHRNPLNYRFPKAKPIEAKYKEEFLQFAHAWSEKLDLIGQRVQVASN